ncbi:MAG: hypothetical protein ACRDJH_07265, partial [Thermomicrobiales bacterium]
HERCPHAMPICVEKAPSLFRTDPTAVTACYLYRDSPIVDGGDLSKVLESHASRPAAVEMSGTHAEP